MQRFSSSLVLILALWVSADRATALGLGAATNSATLGQPLAFAIGLRADPSESLEAKCVKADVSLGDRSVPEALIRTRIETSTISGERRIRVLTTVPVDEPVVKIQLHVGCPVSLSRNFMLFADPPTRAAMGGGDEVSAGNWVADRPDLPVAAALAAAPPSAAASTQGAGQRARRSRASSGAASELDRTLNAAAARPVPPGSSKRSAARRPESRPRPSGGPVLRLDPVESDMLFAPSLQMATSLGEFPDSAASGVVPRFVDPDQELRLRDQERLKAMEAALLKLRGDSEATHKSLTDMQLRVQAAEASRYANPLVYLLGLLCAVLAAAVAAMWWLRRRDRLSAVWWTPPADAVAAPSSVPVAVTAPSEHPELSDGPESKSPTASMAPPPSRPVVSAPMPMFAAPRVAFEPSRPAEADLAAVEPRRPMSAEELIDLEQQAEFFVVLGQDDAAIDLLMGHVRSTGGVSPLPYLKLLEIYRRRGEREPYDRIRERFNRRFNAYAPEWDVDPETGLSLDGYPEVMNRLERAWSTPSQAMDLLDASLFRRDAGPTFDVPAYRELLFLYGMARDLAERDVAPEGVDLLLPFNEGASEATVTSAMASGPMDAPDSQRAHFSLDLDVSSDPPPHLSLEEQDFKKSRS